MTLNMRFLVVATLLVVTALAVHAIDERDPAYLLPTKLQVTNKAIIDDSLVLLVQNVDHTYTVRDVRAIASCIDAGETVRTSTAVCPRDMLVPGQSMVCKVRLPVRFEKQVYVTHAMGKGSDGYATVSPSVGATTTTTSASHASRDYPAMLQLDMDLDEAHTLHVRHVGDSDAVTMLQASVVSVRCAYRSCRTPAVCDKYTLYPGQSSVCSFPEPVRGAFYVLQAEGRLDNSSVVHAASSLFSAH